MVYRSRILDRISRSDLEGINYFCFLPFVWINKLSHNTTGNQDLYLCSRKIERIQLFLLNIDGSHFKFSVDAWKHFCIHINLNMNSCIWPKIKIGKLWEIMGNNWWPQWFQTFGFVISIHEFLRSRWDFSLVILRVEEVGYKPNMYWVLVRLVLAVACLEGEAWWPTSQILAERGQYFSATIESGIKASPVNHG